MTDEKDRLIAEKCMHGTYEAGCRVHNGIMHPFTPSTDLNHAMQALEKWISLDPDYNEIDHIEIDSDGCSVVISNKDGYAVIPTNKSLAMAITDALIQASETKEAR